MTARLLIDGYNLLYASGVFASAEGPPTLERTRTAFLQFLAEVIEEKVRRRSTVVFDATHAPPGLPHEMSFAGLRVLFSRNPDDADTMLEDLLAADRAPREILVVSSDHRVQRAARQRGAKYIDSETWVRDRQQKRRTEQTQRAADDSPQKPSDLQQWLVEFGNVDSRDLAPPDNAVPPARPPVAPAPQSLPTAKPRRAKPRRSDQPSSDDKPAGGWNPFPPGYGEDIE